MSEKKRKSDSNLFAWNAHSSDDPLAKVLTERIASHDPSKYKHTDGSANRSRLTQDILIVGARKLCTDWNDQEGLRLLNEYEHLMATRAAIREGKPLPTAIPTQTQTAAPTESQTSAPTLVEPVSAPVTSTQTVTPPAPKPPEQKKPRREVNLIIGSSGHSEIKSSK